MFPLKVLPDAKHAPFWTRLLAFGCVVGFGLQLWFWLVHRADLIGVWGATPRCLWNAGACGVNYNETWIDLLSAIFLHGDWLHLGFNVWFLLVFGGALEEALGSWRWLICFFFGGIAATLAHAISQPLSLVPVVGASGAIAALLGAFFMRLPRAWVLSYVPPVFLLPIPAPLFLIFWFAFQLSSALGVALPGVLPGEESNVAWWAHLGGFAAGAYFGWRTRPAKRKSAAVV